MRVPVPMGVRFTGGRAAVGDEFHAVFDVSPDTPLCPFIAAALIDHAIPATAAAAR